MRTVNGSEFKRREGSRERVPVLVDLANYLNRELGWTRGILWEHMRLTGDPEGPDITTLDKVFQRGWATPPVRLKMETAYKVELALRHASPDPAIHLDPKKVPMIESLDAWPSESAKRRYYRRKRLEERLKRQWKCREKRRSSSGRKTQKRSWKDDETPEQER